MPCAVLRKFRCSAVFAAEENIPKLHPPHGELQPTFWELHGWWSNRRYRAGFDVLAFFIVWLRRAQTGGNHTA